MAVPRIVGPSYEAAILIVPLKCSDDSKYTAQLLPLDLWYTLAILDLPCGIVKLSHCDMVHYCFHFSAAGRQARLIVFCM